MQAASLKEGTPAFDSWKDVQSPVYMKFYMFEVKKPLELARKRGVKPALLQRGPYTYRMRKPRFNISFTPDEDFVYFHQ